MYCLCIPHVYLVSLQLCFNLIDLFNLLELIEKFQALRVQQRPAWLDITARYDLLDWKFDLLTVHSCLNIISLLHIISCKGKYLLEYQAPQRYTWGHASSSTP